MAMNRMIVNSKVGRDGVLHLDLPLGFDEAEKEVQVTVEAVATKQPMTQEEWSAWVASMAGSWQGDFERMPSGEFEERVALP
jgi:hypothetical protein